MITMTDDDHDDDDGDGDADDDADDADDAIWDQDLKMMVMAMPIMMPMMLMQPFGIKLSSSSVCRDCATAHEQTEGSGSRQQRRFSACCTRRQAEPCLKQPVARFGWSCLRPSSSNIVLLLASVSPL